MWEDHRKLKAKRYVYDIRIGKLDIYSYDFNAIVTASPLSFAAAIHRRSIIYKRRIFADRK